MSNSLIMNKGIGLQPPAEIPCSCDQPSTSRSEAKSETPESSSTDPHFLSTRIAPVSPASSRPSSAAFSHSPCSTPPSRTASPAADGERNRRGSVTSSSSKGKVASSVRRRSLLGINVALPGDEVEEEGGRSKEADVGDGVPTIPEDSQLKTDYAHDSLGLEDLADGDALLATTVRSIVIRDFAYHKTDDRYHGRNYEEEKWGSPDDPETRWGKEKPEQEEEKDNNAGGWGGLGFFGWRSRFGKQNEIEDQSEVNEQVDMADGDADEDYYSSPQLSEPDTFGYAYKILPPLSPSLEPAGLYRAAYMFEGMGASEMSVDEGELLLLSGRGNGNPGWVIARRMSVEDGKVHRGEAVGLVPESYLERVQVLDAE
ncbi:uncharacterized protein IAS62_000513 [Cryptococcus decagattii]|uniref:SH3 domain-containing protein n=1 Tax=Cryptococcus decagattii TaxID=1859122 RepID=A0ABZ2AM19_9TREE